MCVGYIHIYKNIYLYQNILVYNAALNRSILSFNVIFFDFFVLTHENSVNRDKFNFNPTGIVKCSKLSSDVKFPLISKYLNNEFCNGHFRHFGHKPHIWTFAIVEPPPNVRTPLHREGKTKYFVKMSQKQLIGSTIYTLEQTI